VGPLIKEIGSSECYWTTVPQHPWTNGQVDWRKRRIDETTVGRFFRRRTTKRARNCVAAYSFAKRPKTPNGLIPYEFICKCWTRNPKGSPQKPIRLGTNTYPFVSSAPKSLPGWVSEIG
jgi:hypothetical protein